MGHYSLNKSSLLRFWKVKVSAEELQGRFKNRTRTTAMPLLLAFVGACGGGGDAVDTAVPVIVNKDFSVSEGNELILTMEHLQAEDSDDEPDALTYSLVILPQYGVIEQLNESNAWDPLGLSSVFTQQDVNDGRIRYSHRDDSSVADSFTLRVYDDDSPASTSENTVVSIIVVAFDDPPESITLTDIAPSISEDILERTKVADIVSSGDPDGGLPGLEITGEHAEFFSLNDDQTEVYLNSSVALDFETSAVLQIRVQVASNTEIGFDVSFQVLDVNESAESISVELTTGGILEKTPTEIADGIRTLRIKVADISISGDPDGGERGLELAGPNAELFELNDAQTEIFLKSGLVLDFETTPVLNVRVQLELSVGIGADLEVPVLNLPDVEAAMLISDIVASQPGDAFIGEIAVIAIDGQLPRVELMSVADENNINFAANLFEFLPFSEDIVDVDADGRAILGRLQLVSPLTGDASTVLNQNELFYLTFRTFNPSDSSLIADTSITVYRELEQLGTAGEDYLIGKELRANALYGSDADDTLQGFSVGDRLDGGGGIDTVLYFDSDAGVSIDLSADTDAGGFFSGTGGYAEGDRVKDIEYITGSDYDDYLVGNSAVNLFKGAGGNDFLVGGLGADTLDGGSGVDTVSYVDSLSMVTVTLSSESGIPSVAGIGSHAQGDLLIDVENIIGSEFDDRLTGNSEENTLEGGAGADFLDGGEGIDTASFENSDSGVTINLDQLAFNDLVDLDNEDNGFIVLDFSAGGDAINNRIRNIENIRGSVFADQLIGDAGANILEGGQGEDILEGGDGIDTASYQGSSDAVYIDLSAAQVAGDFVIIDSTGDAEGDRFKDIEGLIGTAFNDFLVGISSVFVLDGAAGDDDVRAGEVGSTLLGGSGNDTLLGSSSRDTLIGGIGSDTLLGEAGDDILVGGEGKDLLLGSFGFDVASYADSSAGITIDLLNIVSGSVLVFGGDASGDRLNDIEGIVASNYADFLSGDENNNLFIGFDGGDTIIGMGGMDTIAYLESGQGVTINLAVEDAEGFVFSSGGTAQDDKIKGVENIFGSNSDDTLIGNSTSNQLVGIDGNDFLQGYGGSDYLYGYDGSDTAVYSDSAQGVIINLSATGANPDFDRDDLLIVEGLVEDLDDRLFVVGQGGAEGDILNSIENLIGSNEIDDLQGDSGDNIIEGGGSGDKLDGGSAGSDTLSYQQSREAVNVSLGQLAENSGVDSGFIVFSVDAGGDAGGDRARGFENLLGSEFADVLTGDREDNIIEGGFGGDRIDGGAGLDTAKYTGSKSAVHIDLLQEAFQNPLNINDSDNGFIIVGSTVVSGGDSLDDRLKSIENLIGSNFSDRLIGDNNDNVLEGGRGVIDIIVGNEGADTASYSSSATGVTVSLAQAVESSGVLSGFIILDDTAGGDAVGDQLMSIENLEGSEFADHLTGNTSANILTGNGGDDLLYAGREGDVLNGGSGDDTLFSGIDGDKFDGGEGLDTLSYADSFFAVTVDLSQLVEDDENSADNGFIVLTSSAGGYASDDKIRDIENIVGSSMADILVGTQLSNAFYGGIGNDSLSGGGGADTLDGGDDDDVLIGGAGDDMLRGGGGADIFLFSGQANALGSDIITDFVRGSDVIDLSQLDANGTEDGSPRFVWRGTSAFSNRAGEVRYSINGSDVVVEFNTDTQEDIDATIILINLNQLESSDFIF